VREDLATWQKLNITAFTVSGIMGTEKIVPTRTPAATPTYPCASSPCSSTPPTGSRYAKSTNAP
jgi:hypothetical protein